MVTTTAIINVPHENQSQKSQESQKNYHPSPFHFFMNTLLGSTPIKITSMSGAAEWGEVPIETLIAQGLWPIMMRIASKLDMELSVENDVLNKIAPKTEFLINIGLILRYCSYEEAAKSFRNMLSNMNISATAEDVNSFASIFQSTVATFFADILKNLQKIRQILGQEAKALQNQNQVASKIIFIPIDSEFMGIMPLMGLTRFYQMMDYDYRLNHLEELDIKYLRQLNDACMIYREALKAARLLPISMKDFSKLDLKVRENYDPYIIIKHWLRSAILLSAVNAPIDQGSIGSEDLLFMLINAQGLEDQELINRTLARFANRGSKQKTWPVIQAYFIENWIREEIQFIRNNDLEKIMNQILVHYDFSKPIFEVKKISPKTALIYATSMSSELKKIIHEDKRSEEAIAKALPWSKIELKTFISILSSRNLSAKNLAIGITKLNKKIQSKAVTAWISECQDNSIQCTQEEADIQNDKVNLILGTPEAIAILHRAKLLPEDFLSNISSEDNIPKEPSKDQIIEALLKIYVKNQDNNQIIYALNLMSIAKEATLRSVIEEPKYRYQILCLIREYYSDSQDLINFGGTYKAYKKFWEKLGTPLLLKICLAFEIYRRSTEYNLPKNQLLKIHADEINLPWSKFWQLAKEDTGIYFPIKIDHLLVKSLMKEKSFSEESIFRWAYVGNKQLEAKLKSYLRARDRYYSIIRKKA